MPKWTEYTTKDTLADNDEVMLYDATARANKRGLMSKFWDYVVNKMTTAVIAKLGTTDKTLIGAVNELNSKSLKYKDVRYDVSLTFPSNGYIEFPTNSETKSIWELNNLSGLNIIGAGILNWNASIVYGVSASGTYVYGPSGKQTRNLSIRYYYT